MPNWQHGQADGKSDSDDRNLGSTDESRISSVRQNMALSMIYYLEVTRIPSQRHNLDKNSMQRNYGTSARGRT